MDLFDLRVFVCVADEGGVSAAARLLKIPKSSASRSLVRLEQQLGTVLVERHTRQLRLSDAGRLYLAHARRILIDVAEAGAAIEGLLGEPHGTLRINAAVTFAYGLIAPMLPAFMERFAKLRVILETENRVIDVTREDFDLAIRVGQMPDSELMARKLGDIELWACASPAYLDRLGMPTHPSDLEDHVLLGWVDRTSTWSFTDANGESHQISVPLGTVVPEPAVSQVVIAGGAGIGRLPDFLAQPLIARKQLVRLFADFRSESVEVHAVYPAHRTLSAKVRLFIDALRKHVAAQTAILRNPAANGQSNGET